jgi:invasion protein IalB
MNTALATLAGTALLTSALAFGTVAPAVAQEPAAAPATAATPQSTAKLSYSNKWRIQVSEGAKSDGDIIFQVTPKGGTRQDVSVAVKKGTGENNVAQTIEKSFEKQLDTKKFHVEVDDGEDVLVKKGYSEPDFALQLVSSSVEGVRLNIEKE